MSENSFISDTNQAQNEDDECAEELSLLERFFEYLPLEFWEETARETNYYSFQKKHKSINTTSDELIRFIGINLIMSVLGKPQIRLYWSNEYGAEIIKNTMTRDRYFEIRKNLHFVNNDEHDPTSSDRLWKVRPFLTHIQSKCRSYNIPRYLSIDEQIVPFTGRCMFRQYIPSKPNPVGLKNFVLSTPEGLVLDFIVYTGSGTVAEKMKDEYGIGVSIVLSLTERIQQFRSHCVFTDRFFTSFKSVDALLARGIYQVGTVQKIELVLFYLNSKMIKI